MEVDNGRAKVVGAVKSDAEVCVELSAGNGGVATVVLLGCGDVLSEDARLEVVVEESADVEVNVAGEVAIETIDVVLVAAESDDTL